MAATATTPIAKRRVVGAVVTVFFVAIAIYLTAEAMRGRRKLNDWLKAEPARLNVDLSQTGTVEAPFRQTCQISHGEVILLDVVLDGTTPTAALNGLRGKLVVLDAKGEVVFDADMTGPKEETLGPSHEGAIELARFHPFDNGDYRLQVQVDEPAPALAGRRQAVFARYELCGLEGLGYAIAGLIGAGAGLIGLITGGITGFSVARHGWRVNTKRNADYSIDGGMGN